MQAFHTADYTDHEGQAFRIEYHYDPDMGAPWDNCDGHGPVSDWERRDKHPGELILHEDRGYRRFYDFRQAIKQARREGWNGWDCWPAAQDRGQALQNAVRADYEYLRAWCNDEWHYMGVIVFPLTAEGDELRSQEQSLWGIESCSDSAYLQEVTDDLLREAGAEL